MANPLLYDMVQFFIDEGLCDEDGVDCFRDFSPEEPDDIVVLFEYGSSAVVSFDDMVQRSVQITTRSKDPDLAREKAIALYSCLKAHESAKRIDFTNDRWAQVSLRQTPFKIKIDDNDRFIYGFNVGIATTVY